MNLSVCLTVDSLMSSFQLTCICQQISPVNLLLVGFSQSILHILIPTKLKRNQDILISLSNLKA